MNFSMIRYVLSWVLRLEGAFLALPTIVALIYGEQVGFIYLIWMLVCLIIGTIGVKVKVKNKEMFQKDGFVAVALSWLVISIFGAVPFVVSGEIPKYIDALFEIASGFTTTGASILPDVEALTHASLFWRSFSHWVGGMGVLVFLLMLLPDQNASQFNLMRAESPGPTTSKFVPHLRESAVILYKIYITMTLSEIALLIIIGQMPIFDAICISFGTAGTGGFGVLNSSIGSYSPAAKWIITLFMIGFGVNFGFYYLIRCKKFKEAFKMEEVKLYLSIILIAEVLIVINIGGMYDNIIVAIRDAFFQVGSIITTTGFSTANFDLWPSLSKTILVFLMFVGACAGSTGGGIKVSRILLISKAIKREIHRISHPRSVEKVRLDGHTVDSKTLHTIFIFFAGYVALFAVSHLLISYNEFSFATNFTAVAATLNNIGPGLDLVGPVGNYLMFNDFSKVVLIIDMIAGRLELFPMLMLLSPSVWKRKS